MKSVDLYKMIKAEFPNASIQISDIDYALPKASWLTSTFYDFYKGWRVDHNLNEWTNKNDCVAGFEKVVTNKGAKKISELKDGDVVLTYNFLTKNQEFLPIINFENKGNLQSFNVKYKNHSSVTVSEKHPILYTNKLPWTRSSSILEYSVCHADALKNISSKIYSPCVKQLNINVIDDEHDVDDYFILGHFIAEGWCIENGGTFTSGYDIDTKILPILNRKGIKYYYHKNNSGVPYILFSTTNKLTDWLRSFKENSFNMNTSSLTMLPLEKIESFLKGHWIGDGHNQDNYIVHSTSNDDLAQTIFTMYLRLGRPAQKYYQKNHMGAGNKPIWRVMVNEKSQFSKYFGFQSLSETKLESINDVGTVECFDFSTPNGNYILENGLLIHNCDNFASLFYAFSQICHAKSSRSEQGIAVGEFFYGVGGDKVGKGHAINVAVTDKGIINIEPQTGATMPLNKAEKDSAWFIRF